MSQLRTWKSAVPGVFDEVGAEVVITADLPTERLKKGELGQCTAVPLYISGRVYIIRIGAKDYLLTKKQFEFTDAGHRKRLAEEESRQTRQKQDVIKGYDDRNKQAIEYITNAFAVVLTLTGKRRRGLRFKYNTSPDVQPRTQVSRTLDYSTSDIATVKTLMCLIHKHKIPYYTEDFREPHRTGQYKDRMGGI